jgi:hypothetical protein
MNVQSGKASNQKGQSNQMEWKKLSHLSRCVARCLALPKAVVLCDVTIKERDWVEILCRLVFGRLRHIPADFFNTPYSFICELNRFFSHALSANLIAICRFF